MIDPSKHSPQSPLVSVVIPAYNQAAYIPATVQSVLEQTYKNIEVIVVNDASPDNTTEVVRDISDPRVRLIVHEQNKGLPAARNTGMRASTGDLIALLDADDLFLPEKIQAHVEFFQKHSEIGVSYNARFELNHSAETIRDIWWPPKEVGLLDVVLGFPFSPSDMVIRREWAFQVGLFDESFVNGGEDTDLPCRLALAGCKFAGIDQVLNLRRYHSGRKRRNLPARLQDVINAIEPVFKDPRCTPDVLAIKDMALKHHLIVLVSLAFIQEETALVHQFLRRLVAMDGTVLEGAPSELVDFLLLECIADDRVNHVELLNKIAAQLPEEYAWIAKQFDWAAVRGYLIKGVRAIMFNRAEVGEQYLEQAAVLGAKVDKEYLHALAYQLAGYERVYGEQSTQNIIQSLSAHLLRFGSSKDIHWLKGHYFVEKAFQNYAENNFKNVPPKVLRGVLEDPSYLANRGVMKILLRSLALTLAPNA